MRDGWKRQRNRQRSTPLGSWCVRLRSISRGITSEGATFGDNVWSAHKIWWDESWARLGGLLTGDSCAGVRERSAGAPAGRRVAERSGG